jgi:protein phosphatase methylesterase 1
MAAAPSSSWSSHFDTKSEVKIPGSNDSFAIYQAGVSGPMFVLLHGGGHTSLSWCLVAVIFTAYLILFFNQFLGLSQTVCSCCGNRF